jgi:hypothetical protein
MRTMVNGLCRKGLQKNGVLKERLQGMTVNIKKRNCVRKRKIR